MKPLRKDGRLNPESYDGSLIYWLCVPTSQQNYLQAILEGYDDLGYYQTFHASIEKNEHGEPMSLARLTSSIDAEAETKALLEAFSEEIKLKILDSAPPLDPSEQPKA
ncbi:MAG: hypothetical protein OXG62_02975 [Nitrospinae bacterium]|nr:hypothetical protein [Nitrospinota bacterium]